jgi:predicted nuclease of predicted toxin-antitoxin system
LKLLLDQNLSRRMLADLAPAFPGSTQVQLLGLESADDKLLWRYAKDHGFMIVTLDSDFHELATLYGAPPKIVWHKCGNRPRWYVTGLLLKQRERIDAFGDDARSNHTRYAALSVLMRATSALTVWAATHKSTARWAFSQNSGEFPNRRASRSAISGLTARRSRNRSLMDWRETPTA